METREIIKAILSEIDNIENINDDTLLIEEGILDSMGIMYLISELEDRLSLEIPLENIEEKDFSTIKDLEAFIQKMK